MVQNQSSSGRWEHLAILVVCAGAIACANILTVSKTGGLCFTNGFTKTEACIPEVCGFRKILGISCPACGLTRSFAATARLELQTAFHHHPAGPLLFVICVFQIPYRILRYYEPGGGSLFRNRIANRLHIVTWLVFWILLLTWVVRISGPRTLSSLAL